MYNMMFQNGILDNLYLFFTTSSTPTNTAVSCCIAANSSRRGDAEHGTSFVHFDSAATTLLNINLQSHGATWCPCVPDFALMLVELFFTQSHPAVLTHYFEHIINSDVFEVVEIFGVQMTVCGSYLLTKSRYICTKTL